MTALFCDLVGFTATSESADPEDVGRMLTAYFKMARAQVEALGGVVEKFIGDAVVGVFGVTAGHEDDPERAIRAGLQIAEEAEGLEGVGGQPLKLRVGINTGEALVRLGVKPGSGEGFLAGDAINTASRIQSVAPEMGVAVGLATYEATAQVFDFEELEPARLKGKSEPVRVFHARSSLARLGTDLTRTHDSPYVGRVSDLSMLTGLFDRVVKTSSVQMVTVVGEPGIGKSRIVAELLDHARESEPRLTWRRGRCLPYGEGVTFWALGEIIKAHTGILESDELERAVAKLDNAVPDGPDREWLRQRLLPLVGVDATSSTQRDELFAAWRTFLERVAQQTPTVLVFEDIQWADDAMLAFLEYLADRTEAVPLLLMATARPELFERHSTFAQGLRNANRINLAPLTDADTAELVTQLLEAPQFPEELRSSILERAGGNPLYIEESLRLLKDRDLLARHGDVWVLRSGAEVPLAGSIQSLIAARLDSLSLDRKAMLFDAAVVGTVFWAGAVAQMGDRDVGEVTVAMRELSLKELVRSRRSSMEAEVEYVFSHVLTRDVAYAHLPRPVRAAKHLAAATWLEAKAGERVDEIAEVLAHHYATALELSIAVGSPETEDLRNKAVECLSLAGERTLDLDAVTARSLLRRAMDLAPSVGSGRARIFRLLADAEHLNGSTAEAGVLYEQAAAFYDLAGDATAAGEATRRLANSLQVVDPARDEALLDQLIARFEPEGRSELLARVYSSKQAYDASQPWADRALAIAEELELDSIRFHALDARGMRRIGDGDPGGIEDLRAALDFHLASENTRGAWTGYLNLVWALCSEDLSAAMEMADEGSAYLSARDVALGGTRPIRQWVLLARGRWDELLAEGREMIELAAPGEDPWTFSHAAAPMGLVLARRGLAEAALELTRRAASEARSWLFDVVPIVSHRIIGEPAEAVRLLEEVVTGWSGSSGALDGPMDCELAREALALGRSDVLEVGLTYPAGEMVGCRITRMNWLAIAEEAKGHPIQALSLFREAEESWAAFGDPYEEAHSLLGQGRCLLELSRPSKAALALQHAQDIFQRLRAAPALAEADALADKAAASGSK